ncbi:MAG: hypothetical protein FWC13_05070 [Oscillospiraceae bacterium]|nr:hypothetical protein [Oscillospiraceae bacterium]
MIENAEEKKKEKWGFEDYAFTLTGIIVAFLLVVPEILYAQFDIIILGGSLDTNLGDDYWLGAFTIHDFRALSPLLFLLTTTIVFIKDAVDARKTGGYTGSLFRHTFESLVEDAIYMAVTTAMVFFAVFADTMYISWLAGPLTWVLFIFLFPFIRRKRSDYEADPIPWLLLLIFAGGIITELITGVWIAFPLSWLVICAF